MGTKTYGSVAALPLLTIELCLMRICTCECVVCVPMYVLTYMCIHACTWLEQESMGVGS